MDIGNNVAQVIFQQDELFLGWPLLIQASLYGPRDNFPDLSLADGDTALYLGLFDLCFRVNLFELSIELCNESLLVFFSPPLLRLRSPGFPRSSDI